MAKKTKFFRIAVSGQTASDGRTITEEMLRECVETFNPDTYGVRINMEHLRGFDPDGVFKSYGDVVELKVEPTTLNVAGKDEQRLGLFARLDPTDALVELNRKRQKIYTSIEPQPNFGGTGKYGLLGLAATDSPASLGTEKLKFSVKTDDPAAVEMKADLDRRKSGTDSFFSAAFETRFELEDDTPAQAGPSALERFAQLLGDAINGGKKTEPEPRTPPVTTTPAPQANDFAATMQAFTAAVSADRTADNARTDQRFSDLGRQLGEVKALIEKTQDPNHLSRKPITGGGAGELADC